MLDVFPTSIIMMSIKRMPHTCIVKKKKKNADRSHCVNNFGLQMSTVMQRSLHVPSLSTAGTFLSMSKSNLFYFVQAPSRPEFEHEELVYAVTCSYHSCMMLHPYLVTTIINY